MQAEGKLPEGVPKKYPSAMSAYRIIAKYGHLCVLYCMDAAEVGLGIHAEPHQDD